MTFFHKHFIYWYIQIEPPFNLEVTGEIDVTNFDTSLTLYDPTLIPPADGK